MGVVFEYCRSHGGAQGYVSGVVKMIANAAAVSMHCLVVKATTKNNE